MKNKKRKKGRSNFFLILLCLCFAVPLIIFGSESILKSLYPKEYSEFVEVYTQKNNLSTNFVYAVIKCESDFDPTAVSVDDARGLMQILPDSFDWLQTKTGEKLETRLLFDPETNIRYGTFLYGMFIEEFTHEATAAAAYHAGPGNVRKWLTDEEYSSDGETLHTIPFESTSTYVERVMKTKEIYEKLY